MTQEFSLQLNEHCWLGRELIAPPQNCGHGGGWAYKRWIGVLSGPEPSGRIATEPLPRTVWLFQTVPLIRNNLPLPERASG